MKLFDKAQLPVSCWVLAGFIGIAWEMGGQFIFIIWSEPDEQWMIG